MRTRRDGPFVIEIQYLQGAELKAASELCVRAKAHWGYDAEFMAICTPELQLLIGDLVTSEVVGAYEDKQLVAVLQLVSSGPDALLDKLFVEPDEIGLGIGRMMFEWSVRKSNDWRAKRIIIESDPHAEPAYIAFGCRRIGMVRTELTTRDIPLLEYGDGTCKSASALFSPAAAIHQSTPNQSSRRSEPTPAPPGSARPPPPNRGWP